MRSNVTVGLCLIGLVCSAVGAADWPHWRGPDYNGISKETGFDASSLDDDTKPYDWLFYGRLTDHDGEELHSFNSASASRWNSTAATSKPIS